MDRPATSDNGGQEQPGKGVGVADRPARLTLQLGDEFRGEIATAAAAEQRDLSGMARVLLQQGLQCRSGNHVPVARAGYLALLDLAEENGLELVEVVRLALRYAVQHTDKWIKGGNT